MIFDGVGGVQLPLVVVLSEVVVALLCPMIYHWHTHHLQNQPKFVETASPLASGVHIVWPSDLSVLRSTCQVRSKLLLLLSVAIHQFKPCVAASLERLPLTVQCRGMEGIKNLIAAYTTPGSKSVNDYARDGQSSCTLQYRQRPVSDMSSSHQVGGPDQDAVSPYGDILTGKN